MWNSILAVLIALAVIAFATIDWWFPKRKGSDDE